MIETGGWGGIAHYAWNLAEALARARAEVTLLTNTRYELEGLPRAFRVEGCFDGRHGWLRSARRRARAACSAGCGCSLPTSSTSRACSPRASTVSSGRGSAAATRSS